MKWTSISAIFFLFFAASVFVLLPFGVRTSEEVVAELVLFIRETVRETFLN